MSGSSFLSKKSRKNKVKMFVFVFVAALAATATSVSGSSALRVENGVYDRISVAVSNTAVPREHCARAINNLEVRTIENNASVRG